MFRQWCPAITPKPEVQALSPDRFRELRLIKCSGHSSLPQRLIQRNSAGNGNIQALHHPHHRNEQCTVRQFDCLVTTSPHFVSEHERRGRRQIEFMQIMAVIPQGCCQYSESFFSQPGVAVWNRDMSLHFQPFQR